MGQRGGERALRPNVFLLSQFLHQKGRCSGLTRGGELAICMANGDNLIHSNFLYLLNLYSILFNYQIKFQLVLIKVIIKLSKGELGFLNVTIQMFSVHLSPSNGADDALPYLQSTKQCRHTWLSLRLTFSISPFNNNPFTISPFHFALNRIFSWFHLRFLRTPLSVSNISSNLFPS